MQRIDNVMIKIFQTEAVILDEGTVKQEVHEADPLSDATFAMDYEPPEDEAHPDVRNEYFVHVALSSVKREHTDEDCDLKTLIDIKHELI